MGAGSYDQGHDGLDAILDAADNIVTSETLQPAYTFRKGGGGRQQRGRSKPKAKREPGRPTIEDEPRSVRDSLRMTPTTEATLAKVEVNSSTGVDLLARAIETGDATPILKLSAKFRGRM